MAAITNIEILNFITKAQHKQIALANCIVDSDGEDEGAIELLTELSNCIDSLDSIYNTVPEDEILRTIHHLSNKAKLNNYPVISFPNFNTSVNIVEHVIVEHSGSSSSGAMSRAIEVIDVSQGSYNDGDVIPINTPVTDVIEKMLQVDTPAIYTTPSASLGLSDAVTSVEAGSVIDPTLTPSFVQNDAGAVNYYQLRRGETPLITLASLAGYTDNDEEIGDLSVTYGTTIQYDAGPVKPSRMGNPTPGSILAGTLSPSVTITGKRYLFVGFNTAAATSAEVRAMTPRILGPGNGSGFTINIPAGTTRVVFAYPASLQEVSSVIYVEGLNAQVKPIFAQSTVAVAGANNFTPVNYRVYAYTPDGPFTSAATYNVTI